MDKNIKIKETYAATLMRRQSQQCKVFTCKVQKNHLNKQQKECLKMMFVEAKWMYNHILNLSNEGQEVWNINYKDLDTVKHLDKDKNEMYTPLQYLSSQMRQGVVDGIVSSIRGLAKARQKGNKIGKLNFISEYKSINLKQSNVSYKIMGNNRIKIQGIKKPLKVYGLEQILTLGEYELANAKLIQRCDDYYIAVTVYVNKVETPIPTQKIGIDMGCQTSVTLSDGRKFKFAVEEGENIKELQRRIDRSKKGSNNRFKLRKRLRKAKQKINNKKTDIANKFVSSLKDYQVVMQDEMLSSWQEHGHGKAITNGVLGRIKSLLKSTPHTIVLDKSLPTTKLCTICDHKVSLTQYDRTFVCDYCGHTEDRDVHAAKNMLWFSENIYITVRNIQSSWLKPRSH